MTPLGLIAGEGVFPLLVARGARAAGRAVVCAAFAGLAAPELREEVDAFGWVGVLRLNQWVRVLRRGGCEEAIIVGRVAKSQAYGRWRYFRYIPDLRTVHLALTELRRNKSDQAILQAICRELAKDGITLIDSTRYTPDHLATAGVMSRRQPTARQWQDLRFGWELAQAISRLEIGQALAVFEQSVIAVEAVEGTNAMIERAGQLCRSGGWTMIKVSNTHQDMRLDVPTVGTTTIEKLAAAGAGCLALEVGKTILLEKSKVLELADRHRIAVVGYAPEP